MDVFLVWKWEYLEEEDQSHSRKEREFSKSIIEIGHLNDVSYCVECTLDRGGHGHL